MYEALSSALAGAEFRVPACVSGTDAVAPSPLIEEPPEAERRTADLPLPEDDAAVPVAADATLSALFRLLTPAVVYAVMSRSMGTVML